jgi:hypothetical protein
MNQNDAEMNFVNSCGNKAQWIYQEIQQHIKNSDEKIFYISNNGFEVAYNKETGDCYIKSENFEFGLNVNEQKENL